MEAQAALIDDEIRPHPCHQLSLADDFGCTLHQRDEKVECAATQIERDAILLEESFRRDQTKGTERNDVFTLTTFVVKHLLFRPGRGCCAVVKHWFSR